MGKQRRDQQGQGQGQGQQDDSGTGTGTGATTPGAKTGVIKRLVSEKGFGFIRTENGQEHFFHQSAVLDKAFDDLREGDPVTFIQGATGPKGLRAEQVQRAV